MIIQLIFIGCTRGNLATDVVFLSARIADLGLMRHDLISYYYYYFWLPGF